MPRISLNTAQRLALNIDAHIAIDAGAGTGKTATIVNRVVEHYFSERQRATEILPIPERPTRVASGIIRSRGPRPSDPSEWKGLLPGEVVLLTFTVAAANEMKKRLRNTLQDMQAGPISDKKNTEPRLLSSADRDQLKAFLEDAPIGTIHSFFLRLVTPFLSYLGESTKSQIIENYASQAIRKEAIDIFWKIPSNPDHFTASHSEFLRSDQAINIAKARDRLTKTYSGRRRLDNVLSNLIKKSIFVEEASNRLTENGHITTQKLLDELYSWVAPEQMSSLIETLFENIGDVMETIRKYSHIIAPNGWKIEDRIGILDQLSQYKPANIEEEIEWLSKLTILSRSKPGTGTFFPRGSLPNTEEWPAGILTLSAMGGSEEAKRAKDEMKFGFKNIQMMLETNLRTKEILKLSAMVNQLLNPDGSRKIPIQYPPSERLGIRPKEELEKYAFSIDAEAQHLDDLRLSAEGLKSILRSIKNKQELREFSDILELSADLLLLRCPYICKTEKMYPAEIVRILDDGPDEPWQDDHIERALYCLNEMADKGNDQYPNSLIEKVSNDLQHRFETLKSVRRRYLAFIIDEAQDNSPLQWRLLSRLWGPREVKTGEKEIPDTPWQPTVCYVGDMKQSIYGFRQADPSGFKKYNQYIRKINKMEFDSISSLTRDPPLRKRNKSRDPRYAHQIAFATAKTRNIQSGRHMESWIRFDQQDGFGENLTPEQIKARSEGLIRLNYNFRTKKGLLSTINGWWHDVFSERNREPVQAGWYADAQDLRTPLPNDMNYEQNQEKASEKVLQLQESGHLEWICPEKTRISNNPDVNLDKTVDTISNPHSKRVDRIARYTSLRVKSLIAGSPIRIKKADGSWIQKEFESVEPNEILILMASRSAMRDPLIRELWKQGINTYVDHEGDLFEQPVASAIEALFQLCARPQSKYHAAWVARSPLLSLSDKQTHEFISKSEEYENMLSALSDFTKDMPSGRLVRRWNEMNSEERIIQLLHETLDVSDLLLAYPSLNAKQQAEQAIQFISKTLEKENGSLLLAADTLRSIREDSDGGEQSMTNPSADAVRLMSIHQSKGLESKVVILVDLFSQALVGQFHENVDRFAASPEIFAANPRPWGDDVNPALSVMWDHARRTTKSRRDAEARRLLYVAATRAEDRLIIVGSPQGELEPEWIDGEGLTFTHWNKNSYWGTPLGYMITDSMRAKAIDIIFNENNAKENPLPSSTDEERAVVVHQYSKRARTDSEREIARWVTSRLSSSIDFPLESKYQISLDPGWMAENPSFIGGDSSIPILMMHSSDCFEVEEEQKTPFNTMNQISKALLETPERTQSDQKPSRGKPRKVRIYPSSLHGDSPATNEHVYFEHAAHSDFSATELGDIVHRIVELGVGHPGVEGKIDLPSSWTQKRPNRLTDQRLIKTIITEQGLDYANKQLCELVSELTRRLEHGHLGLLSTGKRVDGHRLLGLRTELPFSHTFGVEFDPILHGPWAPEGFVEKTLEDRALVQLQGFIDLVICTEDPSGRNTLRVADIKTDGCRRKLPELQHDMEGHEPSTENEFALLRRHGIQLAIYDGALRAMNSQAPEEKRRLMLPPAIVWPGNGRMIEYPDKMMTDLRSELKQLLQIKAREHLNSRNVPLLDHGNSQ